MALPKIELKHDKQIRIATGASRKSIRWTNTAMLWSELVARLSVPHRTTETLSEYQNLAKAKRDVIKDVGGFVGGSLKEGRRKAENIESRSIVTLDLDSIPTGTEIWPLIRDGIGCAACMYSTHSHTKESNRLRVVIPLKREVTPDEYGAVSRRLAESIGIDYCDDTTYEPHRLMYWASCSVDADYRFEVNDDPLLDPDEILATYFDWTDTQSWPVSSRQSSIIAKQIKKQGNPLEKPGVIGAFCKVYDIPKAMETFLPGVYTPAGEDRYTYAEGSTAAGVVLYENGLFAYSHHGTDPISGKLVNAFDLVRLHKFAELDDDLPETTAITKKASYKEMIQLATADEEVAYQLALDRVADGFDDDEEVDTDWMRGLEVTSKGGIANTVDNIKLILLNDPRLAGRYYYDAFRERPIVSEDLPWIELDKRTSSTWSDVDDAGLRCFLESEYKIESAMKIRDAVELAMTDCMRHPVREYLEGLEWDGDERLRTLFSDYLGAEDSVYTRAVTKAALIGAVARILSPGCKHDHILVLVGPQGCRKSTTLAKLGQEWFSDSLYTLSGKEAYEQIQGVWIIEMAEMAAAKKSELEQIKHFTAKQSDSYRAAYARRAQDHPRQCVFFGTTNDDEFLRDQTGARRFWPVVVTNEGRRHADRLTPEVVDQMWAEAVEYYKRGDRWHLTEEEENLAREVQEAHTEQNEKTGMIEKFLECDVPEDWANYTLEQRRVYWSSEFEPETDTKTVPRTKVCALEIWCELFNGEPKRFSQAQAREINAVLNKFKNWTRKNNIACGRPYGRQRGFTKI